MTLYDLWKVSPQNFIFIVDGDGVEDYRGDNNISGLVRKEYHGEAFGKVIKIDRIIATKYPMYEHVIEVIIKW